MVPVAYSYRNLLVRWKTTLMTATGFTLVVAVLIVMLAFVSGVRTVCAVTGQEENVICLNKGNTDETFSRIELRAARQLSNAPGVLRDDTGLPLASRELFMMSTQPGDKPGQWEFLQLRGVYPDAFQVHTQVRIVHGRAFKRQRREVIAGAVLARNKGIRVGDKLPVGQIEWDVVGIFEAQGSAFESELWGDLDQLAGQFNRQGTCTSVVLRTGSAQSAEQLVDFLGDWRQVAVEAMPEESYYAEQAEQTKLLRNGAMVIAVFMAIGAAMGVTNTMFAAIGARITDIAVLRVLGFSRTQILVAFLFEAQLIAIVGGLLGSLFGYALNGITLDTAMGAKQVAFAFQINAQILLSVAVFTVVMGFIGGLLPAVSAMRIKPLDSFR